MNFQMTLTISLLTTAYLLSGNCIAKELGISKEQQLMLSGSIKGVGCVTIKNIDDISIFDKKKALLRAKASLLTNTTVAGKERLSISGDDADAYKVVVNHFSDGEQVVSEEPLQAYSFHGASGVFYCIRI